MSETLHFTNDDFVQKDVSKKFFVWLFSQNSHFQKTNYIDVFVYLVFADSSSMHKVDVAY